MHSVAGLDTLTSGTVLIGDTDISKLDDRKLTQLRRDRIGFIFQAFNPRLLAGVGPLRRVPCSGGRSGHGWGRQGLQGDIELLGAPGGHLISCLATRWRGPSTPRSRRVGAVPTAACTSTYPACLQELSRRNGPSKVSACHRRVRPDSSPAPRPRRPGNPRPPPGRPGSRAGGRHTLRNGGRTPGRTVPRPRGGRGTTIAQGRRRRPPTSRAGDRTRRCRRPRSPRARPPPALPGPAVRRPRPPRMSRRPPAPPWRGDADPREDLASTSALTSPASTRRLRNPRLSAARRPPTATCSANRPVPGATSTSSIPASRASTSRLAR
jgi:hypothetical protein